jgi:hypothetical protein
VLGNTTEDEPETRASNKTGVSTLLGSKALILTLRANGDATPLNVIVKSLLAIVPVTTMVARPEIALMAVWIVAAVAFHAIEAVSTPLYPSLKVPEVGATEKAIV